MLASTPVASSCLPRRCLFPWLLLTLVAPALLVSCGQDNPSRAARKAFAVPVTVAAAAQKTVPQELRVVGKVEALVTISVKSRVMGQLVKAHFKEGEMVRKGQPLFDIDPRPYQVALKEAEAKLARDTALAKKAEDDLKRYQKLAKQKTVSASQFEQYQTEALVRRATVEADRAEVDNARLNLGYCSIKAPVDGVTGNLLLNEGNLVKANDDKPLVVIHQVRPIYVSMSVPEQYLGRIMELRRRQAVRVMVEVPGRSGPPLAGELTFLDNAVDSATGTVQIKATFPNQDLALWPGQFARAALVLAELKDQVVVPSQAVLTGQKGHYLYVLEPDAKVSAREVRLGPRVGAETVITSGLKPGEKVVVDGQSRLTPGATVTIKPNPSAQGSRS
ncbi:MAG: efflux RND transporter periplasmic adaptor subunit [Thermodesulfobacteriota bacterium]